MSDLLNRFGRWSFAAGWILGGSLFGLWERHDLPFWPGMVAGVVVSIAAFLVIRWAAGRVITPGCTEMRETPRGQG